MNLRMHGHGDENVNMLAATGDVGANEQIAAAHVQQTMLW